MSNRSCGGSIQLCEFPVNTISSVKLSSDREHLGIEQSLHFTHLALHSIIPTVDTLRRRERWQKASKWEHDSHAGTEAYMSDSFRHGASPLSFCTKAYMACNSNNYILCWPKSVQSIAGQVWGKFGGISFWCPSTFPHLAAPSWISIEFDVDRASWRWKPCFFT